MYGQTLRASAALSRAQVGQLGDMREAFGIDRSTPNGWRLTAAIGEEQPKWACDALIHILRFPLEFHGELPDDAIRWLARGIAAHSRGDLAELHDKPSFLLYPAGTGMAETRERLLLMQVERAIKLVLDRT